MSFIFPKNGTGKFPLHMRICSGLANYGPIQMEQLTSSMRWKWNFVANESSSKLMRYTDIKVSLNLFILTYISVKQVILCCKLRITSAEIK